MLLSTTSIEKVTCLIVELPVKQCSLDLLPAWLMEQCKTELAPFLTDIFNSSLEAGEVLTVMKEAVISPRIKKFNLDLQEFSNYRTVSDLSIASKLLERLVVTRFVVHLEANHLLPSKQSAYKSTTLQKQPFYD